MTTSHIRTTTVGSYPVPAWLVALPSDQAVMDATRVIDVKVNHVETADEIAARIEKAERTLGGGRVQWVHPDCGFWMVKRSVADRKMAALAQGRNLYLGINS